MRSYNTTAIGAAPTLSKLSRVCHTFQNLSFADCFIDWYENKVRHKWYLPSLNAHVSPMPHDHWSLTPKNTNIGEGAHAHTNLYTGTGLSLLVSIER